MIGKVTWNQDKKKFELSYEGKVLVRSKTVDYLKYLVSQQKHSAIVGAKITSIEIFDHDKITVLDAQDNTLDAQQPVEPQVPTYTITERFEFMESLIGMVIRGDAKSMVISGEGGVGKTFSVLAALRQQGLIDVNTVQPTVDSIMEIKVPDSQPVIEDKIIAQMDSNRGDYIVVKGHSSAKSLYRLMFENRNRIIIFDDCDSVLRDGSAIDLLKAALDSYEDRWVSWKSDTMVDLPSCFKFNGSIIFISNRRLSTIDEAIRTRCFKVDLSMTKLQRIERMRSVLHNVMESIALNIKEEVLNFMEANLHLTDDINFRSLMNLILIRTSAGDKWEKLAAYALTEQ